MTVLLVVFTLVFFLLLDHLVQRKIPATPLTRRAGAAKAQTLIGHSPDLPDDVTLAVNHTWMRPNDDGTVTVGLDAFLGRLLGPLDRVSLPCQGEVIVPALPGIEVGIQEKILRLASPVTGRIVEVNPEVLMNPRYLLSDPYGKGWLVRVKSKVGDLASWRRYIVGHPVEWLQEQSALVRDFLAIHIIQGQPAMLQEGGVPVEGILQLCEEEVWQKFARSFASLEREEMTGSREEPL